MLEIELFYKIVESEIRHKHSEYLEEQKREAVPVALPVVYELPKGEEWKKLNIIARFSLKKRRRKQLKELKKAKKERREIRVADKLLKGYNSGVRMALKVLQSEYSTFDRRLKEEDKTKKRI